MSKQVPGKKKDLLKRNGNSYVGEVKHFLFGIVILELQRLHYQ
mgnify:CR=1 FL=1